VEKTYDRTRLLRARHNRQSRRCSANKCDEFAPLHVRIHAQETAS
jgi:hypothetical protein